MPGLIDGVTIAVATSSRGLRRHVTRALASAGGTVVSMHPKVDSFGAVLPPQTRMVILGTDEEAGILKGILDYLFVSRPQIFVLVLAHAGSSDLLARLVGDHGLNNLIARHGGLTAGGEVLDEHELIVTCAKLLNRDIFGLDKYLPTWGVSAHRQRILTRADKHEAIDHLRSFLEQIDCPKAIIPAVETSADELIMNGIFNAPVDGNGQPKYVQLDRRSDFALLPEEAVDFDFACDGRQVVVAVADPFGSLRREAIMRYLERGLSGQRAGIEQKEAGAGLGLFMVFNTITQLTFNVQRGKRTEVLASFYIRSGVKGYRASGRSLNIFYLTD